MKRNRAACCILAWVFCILGLLGCGKEEPSFILGMDASCVPSLEAGGIQYCSREGECQDVFQILADAGVNYIRVRIWNDPYNADGKGYGGGNNDIDKAVRIGQRATKYGMKLLVNFHYSDFFADPSRQNIPVEWADYNLAQMKQAVANHTTEVLSALKAEGVTPEWIQVGNETRNGMLWPMGQLWNNNGDLPNGWKNYAALTTAGYDACKAIFPEALVIVHIDNAYENNNWFFRKLKQNGGKFDMIGLSHYPMMKQWSGKDWGEMNQLAAQNIVNLHSEFQCPVMVVEIGTYANDSNSVNVITDFRQRVDTMEYMKGIFYWEPQVYNGWRPQEYIPLGWGSYHMGAFTQEGQPNDALKQLWKR